jgi:hypothetical protein
MRGPLSILSTDKDFVNPWIGNPTANRLGLHVSRIVLADALDRVRWARHSPLREDREWIEELRRDGVVAIPDFLDPPTFAAVRAEVVATIRDSLGRFPPRDNDRPGFGAKEPFGGIGFDRFDGGTLNRFIDLSADRIPHTLAMVQSERFARLYRAAQGRDFPQSAVSLYYTRHGSEDVHDIQKDLHSDTFHFTVKLWYYVEDVRPQDGPLVYVRGSNHSTARRLKWEYRRSVAAASGRSDKGGSFRVSEEELQDLGYPPPTAFAVPGNTLIIADTNGFHRRGDAEPGAERFGVYGGMRRSPFLL